MYEEEWIDENFKLEDDDEFSAQVPIYDPNLHLTRGGREQLLVVGLFHW